MFLLCDVAIMSTLGNAAVAVATVIAINCRLRQAAPHSGCCQVNAAGRPVRSAAVHCVQLIHVPPFSPDLHVVGRSLNVDVVDSSLGMTRAAADTGIACRRSECEKFLVPRAIYGTERTIT